MGDAATCILDFSSCCECCGACMAWCRLDRRSKTQIEHREVPHHALRSLAETKAPHLTTWFVFVLRRQHLRPRSI